MNQPQHAAPQQGTNGVARAMLVVAVLGLILAVWVARDDLPNFGGGSDEVASATTTTEPSTSASGEESSTSTSSTTTTTTTIKEVIEPVVEGLSFNCEPVILRSGALIPSQVTCASGELIVTGDTGFDWNTDLTGWEIDGVGKVEAQWEEYRESSPGANDWSLHEAGTTTWTETGEHTDGDQANDRYQTLNIEASEGFTLKIWQHGGQAGASVTFTHMPA